MTNRKLSVSLFSLYFNGIIGNKSHHATPIEDKYKVVNYRDIYIDLGFTNKEQVIQNKINIDQNNISINFLFD